MESENIGLGSALTGARMVRAAPRQRLWLLADRVDVSRAAAGLQVQARLNGVPAQDSLGRHAHVLGIRVQVAGSFNLASTSDAVASYRLRSMIDSLFLEGSNGWQFWNGSSDARKVIDDSYYRHYRRTQFSSGQTGAASATTFPDLANGADGGLPTNGNNAAYFADMSFYMPLTKLGIDGPSLEGAIPLAYLQRAGSNAFRFQLRSEPKGAQLTGVTLNGFYTDTNGTREGLNIWLDVAYLPAIVADRWMVDNYTLTELSGQLRYPGRVTEYAHIRYQNEDDITGTGLNAGEGMWIPSTMDQFTLQNAGQVVGSLTRSEMATRMTMAIVQSLDSDLNSQNAVEALPIVGPVIPGDGGSQNLTTMFLWPSARHRMACASGPLQFQYGTSLADYVRYLHRTVPKMDEDFVKDVLRSTKCDPCGSRQILDDGTTGAMHSSIKPVIILDKRSLQRKV